jgi:hypothetical protein
VYERIWVVVEAVNTFDEFSIEYPASEIAQLKIADKFEKVSKEKFNNCAGAIDGILIWILKPSKEDVNDAGCGRRIFFVVVRGNLGLTRQFPTSVVDIWIHQLDYRVHLWTAMRLREVIFMRGWRAGYKRMGLFCMVILPTLIRDTWQHPFQTFHQVARTAIIFFSLSCASVSSAPIDNWSAGGEF